MISAPYLNPVTFRPINNGAYAYNTRHFDEWWHWEQYQKENPQHIYFQPHIANKPFNLQFESDQSALNYKILNCKGAILDAGAITTMLGTIFNALYFIAPNQIKTNIYPYQSWMQAGTIINITGSSNPLNNGTYTIASYTIAFSGVILTLTTPIPDPSATVGTAYYNFSNSNRFYWNFDVVGLGITVNDEDVIYICVDDGIGNALITEPIRLYTALPDNVIEFKATGYRNDFDWIFYENGNISLPLQTPYFYAEAHINDYEPANEAERYDDQLLSHTTLSGTPFRVFKLFIGDDYGVPNYVIDKINRYLLTDQVYLDGKEFTVNGKAKMEIQRNKFYSFVGADIELRESQNKFQLKI